jgi:predicted HTH domain antitoxin
MRKEQLVASRLPDELVQDLELIERWEQTDRSTTVRKLLRQAIGDWKRAHYAQQYGEGRITLARAAQEAGISLWEMIDYLRQRKIAAQYDLADFEQDAAMVLGESGVESASARLERRMGPRAVSGDAFYSQPHGVLGTLAAEQGVRPVRRFEDLLGDFWPEDESADDFITAIRQWRREGGRA